MQQTQTSGTLTSIQEVRAQQDSDTFLPKPSESFVLTPALEAICDRALAYLEAGYPVHLAGPPGIGKTTMAFHLAATLERPTLLMHGNHEFKTSDLVGSKSGYKRSKVVDNYIHTVLKTQEEFQQIWSDNRLTKACREGYTLIYDEFNRTRPEANNVLLSVLEERVLSTPGRRGASFMKVHPDFRAILTSNPEEYAGTHRAQDAIMDRLITIQMPASTLEAEAEIAAERSGIDIESARSIAELVRYVRVHIPTTTAPSLRSAIAICKILNQTHAALVADDPFVVDVCRDILLSSAVACTPDERRDIVAVIDKFIFTRWARLGVDGTWRT